MGLIGCKPNDLIIEPGNASKNSPEVEIKLDGLKEKNNILESDVLDYEDDSSETSEGDSSEKDEEECNVEKELKKESDKEEGEITDSDSEEIIKYVNVSKISHTDSGDKKLSPPNATYTKYIETRRVCSFFVQGRCKYGNNCYYLHPKTSNVRNYQPFYQPDNARSQEQYYQSQYQYGRAPEYNDSWMRGPREMKNRRREYIQRGSSRDVDVRRERESIRDFRNHVYDGNKVTYTRSRSRSKSHTIRRLHQRRSSPRYKKILDTKTRNYTSSKRLNCSDSSSTSGSSIHSEKSKHKHRRRKTSSSLSSSSKSDSKSGSTSSDSISSNNKGKEHPNRSESLKNKRKRHKILPSDKSGIKSSDEPKTSSSRKGQTVKLEMRSKLKLRLGPSLQAFNNDQSD